MVSAGKVKVYFPELGMPASDGETRVFESGGRGEGTYMR